MSGKFQTHTDRLVLIDDSRSGQIRRRYDAFDRLIQEQSPQGQIDVTVQPIPSHG